MPTEGCAKFENSTIFFVQLTKNRDIRNTCVSLTHEGDGEIQAAEYGVNKAGFLPDQRGCIATDLCITNPQVRWNRLKLPTVVSTRKRYNSKYSRFR